MIARLRPLLLVLLGLLGAGCASAPPVESAPPPAAAPPAAAPWADGVAGTSNDGRYTVVYRPRGGPIERGETFALDAWVLDASGRRPLRDVTLSVDAAMPQHGHGMNRVPEVRADGDGHFVVEGMLFHMVGRWELYLAVTRGPQTERAQFEVLLE
jgi:hypothetical protein